MGALGEFSRIGEFVGLFVDDCEAEFGATVVEEVEADGEAVEPAIKLSLSWSQPGLLAVDGFRSLHVQFDDGFRRPSSRSLVPLGLGCAPFSFDPSPSSLLCGSLG